MFCGKIRLKQCGKKGGHRGFLLVADDWLWGTRKRFQKTGDGLRKRDQMHGLEREDHMSSWRYSGRDRNELTWIKEHEQTLDAYRKGGGALKVRGSRRSFSLLRQNREAAVSAVCWCREETDARVFPFSVSAALQEWGCFSSEIVYFLWYLW